MEHQQEEKKKFVRKIKHDSSQLISQTVEKQMEILLQQAEYYANFLLSHQESARKGNLQDRNKKRGRFAEE